MCRHLSDYYAWYDKNILVATGSRPFHPDNIPFDDPNIWDSDEFFSPGRQLPKSIFIAGGGLVGVNSPLSLPD